MNSKVLESISSNIAGLQLALNQSKVSIALDSITDEQWNRFLPYHCDANELLVAKMAVRTWIKLVKELSEVVALTMCARIMSPTYNLVKMLEEAELCYDCYTKQELPPEGNIFSSLLTSSEQDMSLMATSLRFLSRFCPSKWRSEKLSGETILSFMNLQSQLRGLYKDQFSQYNLRNLYIEDDISEEIDNCSRNWHIMVSYHGITSQVNNYVREDYNQQLRAAAFSCYHEGSPAMFSLMREHYSDLDLFLARTISNRMKKPMKISRLFTTGAISDGGRDYLDSHFRTPVKVTTSDKLGKALRLEHYLEQLTGVATPWESRPSYPLNEVGGISWDPMKVLCVPKNYKKCRVIAPCSALTCAVGNHLFDVLSSILRHTFQKWSTNKRKVEITYLDQMLNRDVAYEGSLGGEWDTLDLKNASDRNRCDVFEAILPNTYASLLKYLPRYMRYNTVSPLYSLALAGFPATYLLECIYFWLGVDYSEYLLEKYSEPQGDLAGRVCGDDIAIDSSLTPTVVDILSIMGCEVNAEKSFTNEENLFRESCGGYYKRGWSIDPIFFPRRGITLDERSNISDTDLYGSSWNPALNQSELHTSLSTSVSLANSLVEYPEAHMEVCAFILEHTPKGVVTASTHFQETGIRTPFITVTRSCGSNYATIQHVLTTGKEMHDGRHELRFRSELKVDHESMLLDAERYPMFWKPNSTKVSLMGYLGEHMKKQRVSPSDYYFLEFGEWLIYQAYLEQGPSYEDPLMELLHCSSRRTVF